jgi:hypothetical protein
MMDDDVVTLLRRVGDLIDQTDRWRPDKCVAAIETPEARKGRAAFYELCRRIGGGLGIREPNEVK